MNKPSKDPAPLFTDCYDLSAWILGHFNKDTGYLARTLCARSLALTDAITLALQDRDRKRRLEAADEILVELRLRLRLAGQNQQLDDRQLLFGLQCSDRIGRQIGGWLRRL